MDGDTRYSKLVFPSVLHLCVLQLPFLDDLLLSQTENESSLGVKNCADLLTIVI